MKPSKDQGGTSRPAATPPGPQPRREANTERLAAASAALARRIIESAKDYAIFSTDPERRVTSWSAGAQALFGYPADEILGRSADLLFTPGDRALGAPQHEAGQALTHGSARNERWHARKDGSRFYGSGMVTPLCDESGTVTGLAKVVRDLTRTHCAEEALRASEQRYRTLLESMDEGFCVLQLIFDEQQRPVDYRHVQVNRAFERQGGHRNALGRTMRELAPETDPFWFDTYGKVALGGEPAHFEHHAQAEDRWFEVYAARMGQPEQHQVAVLFSDITVRKRNEANLALLAGISRDLVGLNTVEQAMSAAGAKIGAHFNVSRCVFEEIDQASDQLKVEHEWHLEDLANLAGAHRMSDFVDEEFLRASRAGGTIVVRDVHDDPRVDTANVSALGIRSFIAQPLLRNGEWRFTLAIYDAAPRDWRDDEVELMRELSVRIWTRLERADAEAALQESQLRLQHALDAGAMGTFVWHVAEDRTEADARTHALFAQPADSDLNFAAALAMRIHPEDAVAHAERVVQAIDPAGDGTLRSEYRINRPDGIRWIEACGRTQFEGDPRRATRMIGTLADITPRKRAEEAIRQAGRNKDRFLAMLAHELRNPLAPISNGLEVLRQTQLPSAEGAATLTMMSHQVDHIVRLVDDLLDVSRISRGKVDLQRNPVELAPIVHRAVEAARPLFDNRNRELLVTLPTRPICLDADAARLTQVVGNLLNNAAKYTGDGGCVRLAVERQGDEALVCVSDDGIGIAADQLERIFEIFTQVDTSPARTQTGLGLGLSLVKDLVELHGGQVEARSEGPGKGSEFIVRLPTIDEPAEPVEPAPQPPATALSGQQMLVVDDNVDSADSLAAVLRLAGNGVSTRYDGTEAVEAAAQLRPDVVLLDIGMPGLDGYEVCRRIRAQDWGRSMVLIALTGWGQVEDRMRSDEAGFDAHVVKPVKPDMLMDLIARLLPVHGYTGPR